MKKTKDYTLHTLLFCFGLACLFNLPGCYEGKTQDKGTDAPKIVKYDFEGERLAARIKQAYKTATIRENGETFIDQSILNDEIDLIIYENPVKNKDYDNAKQ